MSSLPPGLIYLSIALVKSLIPAIVVRSGIFLLYASIGTHVPRIVSWICTVCAFPVFLIVKRAVISARQQREMLSLGARTIPLLKGKKFGNFDLLLNNIKAARNDYIAAAFWQYIEKFGTTWNVDVFGAGFIFTVEPVHVKEILSTQSDAFEKGRVLDHAMKNALGSGVFNSDGDMWRFH